jgi:hypothetical protein
VSTLGPGGEPLPGRKSTDHLPIAALFRRSRYNVKQRGAAAAAVSAAAVINKKLAQAPAAQEPYREYRTPADESAGLIAHAQPPAAGRRARKRAEEEPSPYRDQDRHHLPRYDSPFPLADDKETGSRIYPAYDPPPLPADNDAAPPYPSRSPYREQRRPRNAQTSPPAAQTRFGESFWEPGNHR